MRVAIYAANTCLGPLIIDGSRIITGSLEMYFFLVPFIF